jgi:hypothetical protein
MGIIAQTGEICHVALVHCKSQHYSDENHIFILVGKLLSMLTLRDNCCKRTHFMITYTSFGGVGPYDQRPSENRPDARCAWGLPVFILTPAREKPIVLVSMGADLPGSPWMPNN